MADENFLQELNYEIRFKLYENNYLRQVEHILTNAYYRNEERRLNESQRNETDTKSAAFVTPSVFNPETHQDQIATESNRPRFRQKARKKSSKRCKCKRKNKSKHRN